MLCYPPLLCGPLQRGKYVILPFWYWLYWKRISTSFLSLKVSFSVDLVSIFDIDKICSDVWCLSLGLPGSQAGRLRLWCLFTHKVCLFKAAQDFTTLLDIFYLPWTPSPGWTPRSPRTAVQVTPWSPQKREEPGPRCQHPSAALLGGTLPETTTEITR